MKRSLVACLIAGFAASALAFVPLHAQPEGQPPNVQPPAAPVDDTPAVPVPDGPAVNTEELEGGLIVEDLVIGDGYEVKEGGAVVAFYHGTLKADGTVFDSAFDRGEPVGFSLGHVIQGWQKGVPGMKIGGVRRLTIPAALGYGPGGAGDKIPPNADLVFVIQIVDALQVEDLVVGTGTEVSAQFLAATAYTVTGENGEVIEQFSTADPYIWVPGEFQPIDFGVPGMKVGGKRRLTVPKEFNYAHPQAMSARPEGVPVVIEVELLGVRNFDR